MLRRGSDSWMLGLKRKGDNARRRKELRISIERRLGSIWNRWKKSERRLYLTRGSRLIPRS